MSRAAAVCKGFTFPAIPIEVIKSWTIPGVKIEPDGTIHSRRCVQRGTKRAPVCKECNQMQSVVAVLVENVEDDEEDKESEMSEEIDEPPASPKRQATDRKSRSISKKSRQERPKAMDDSQSNSGKVISLKDADQVEERATRSKKQAKPKKIAADFSTPDLEDQLEDVMASLPETLPADDGINEDANRKVGEAPVEPGTIPKRTRKRTRKCSDASAVSGKPKKSRRGSSKKTRRRKSTVDPIIDLCRRLISEAKKANDDSDGQNRTFPCHLCKKEISFFTKDGRIAAYKARNHALIHLILPEQRFYKCKLCDERKKLSMHIRMHILVRHREEASTDNWKDFCLDESALEENRQVITDIITKCFDQSQKDETDTAEKEPEQTEVRKPEADSAEGDKSQSPADTSESDPIREYCLRLIQEKQNNGSLKCLLCKNVSVNVSIFNSDTIVIQRMKTHAFLHQSKRFYKCRICDFMTTTHVLMSRHVNATHGKPKRGDVKFDDLSTLEENRGVILRALERCFENERVNSEANEAAAIILHEAAIADAPAAFVYLLPNGDLVLPGDIDQPNGELNLEGSFPNVNRIPPGCIVTLQTPEGLEEMTVLLQ